MSTSKLVDTYAPRSERQLVDVENGSLTFYLSDEETLKEQEKNFVAAERGLKACITRAADTQTWAVSNADALYIAALLQLHDDQLRLVPVHRLDKAKHRLDKLFAQGEGFPSFDF
ncbi:hypothetical protein [Caballeronia sp. M23-90]